MKIKKKLKHKKRAAQNFFDEVQHKILVLSELLYEADQLESEYTGEKPLTKERAFELAKFIAETMHLVEGRHIEFYGDEGFCLVDQNCRFLFIAQLYLKPEFRGKGVGTEILTRLHEDLPLILLCNPQNPAMNFYKKLGFFQLETPPVRGLKWLVWPKEDDDLELANLMTKDGWKTFKSLQLAWIERQQQKKLNTNSH